MYAYNKTTNQHNKQTLLTMLLSLSLEGRDGEGFLKPMGRWDITAKNAYETKIIYISRL